jgi:hypothetical protein
MEGTNLWFPQLFIRQLGKFGNLVLPQPHRTASGKCGWSCLICSAASR